MCIQKLTDVDRERIMKLVCPGCGKMYRIDERKLPAAAAKTRCKTCETIIPITRPELPAANRKPPVHETRPESTLVDPHGSRAVVGGAFLRISAFLIDAALVFFVIQAVFSLLALAIPIPEGMPSSGIFLLALIYFSIGNSAAAGGQTIGKRITRIRVQSRNGASISPLRSALRSAVLIGPIYLVFYGFPLCETGNALIIFTFAFLLSTPLLNTYLILFNTATRQAIHDITINSFVVASQPQGTVASAAFGKKHIVGAGLIVLLIVIAVLYVFPVGYAA